jgi:hypothetical protein
MSLRNQAIRTSRCTGCHSEQACSISVILGAAKLRYGVTSVSVVAQINRDPKVPHAQIVAGLHKLIHAGASGPFEDGGSVETAELASRGNCCRS